MLRRHRWRMCGALVVVATIATAFGIAARAQQPAATSAPPPSVQAALVGRYCLSCHNARLKTGGLALDTIDINHVAGNRDVWEKVVRKLRVRAMPPPAPGRDRPG